MTRPGFGDEPAEGRHGAPSTGRHADPGRPSDGARARHAEPEATGDDGRAAVERALRARPPAGRRRSRAEPAPVVTQSDEQPGRWNGFGPGALVLPTQPNGHAAGRQDASGAVGPEPVDGYPTPPAPVDDWQVERPTLRPAEPEAPAPNGWHTHPEPPPLDGWPAQPEPPAPNGWHAQPAPATDYVPPPPADDWQVEQPTLRPAEPEPPMLNGWPAEPEPPAPNGWHAQPAPATDYVPPPPADDWQVEQPTLRPAEPDPPMLNGWPAEPEPPAPAGWHAQPAPATDYVPPPPADDWQVERPTLRPADPERIGDLPRPVVDPPDGRRPARPRTGEPLNGWHATPPPQPPRVNGRRPGDPLPPPAAGWRAADQRLRNGYSSAAHPLGERVVHVFDGDSTQLLKRYVPAQETLQREDREPPSPRPQTLPKHPPRAVVRRRRTRRRLLEWPFLIVFALLSAYLIRAYVVQTFYIPSGSMHETLLEGDRVLVNKISYHMHDVNRGDVVVFRRPPDFPVEDEDLIKRVVALPGETVEARGRQIYVDGKPLTEPYVEPRCKGTQDFAPVTVPAGDLWVMGDNRCNSSDSRVFGPISDDLLVGRAFVLAWPFARLSWL